ncbi:MAG: alcohol dehydrogenase [Myxococcales bacterium]|nr:alcohol dehydrogenase [Myxococcales bacterium]
MNTTGFDTLGGTLSTRVLFGAGCIAQLAQEVQRLGGARVLLVSDRGLADAGHVAQAQAILNEANIASTLYLDVQENPTDEDVSRCADVARNDDSDILVGLGGGSAMDAAKGANLLLTQGGRIQDYWGMGKVVAPMLPLIAIPTTAGTGSEVQQVALISDAQTHQKMACGDPALRPATAILDPNLTLSQPWEVACSTALDAMTHALESVVTTARTDLSQRFSTEAFRLGYSAAVQIMEGSEDPFVRGEMLKAACYAGLAIDHSMLGAAHSCANPLTQTFGLRHGFAVGVMLPHVIAFNAQDSSVAAIYGNVARTSGLVPENAPDKDAVDALISAVDDLCEKSGAKQALRALHEPVEHISSLASGAAEQWTAQYNPREVGVTDFEDIYRSALTR